MCSLNKTQNMSLFNSRNLRMLQKYQTGKSIKYLRSDKGGEYLSLVYQGFLKKMVLFIKRHLRTHHSTMACQRGGIEPYSNGSVYDE